jgi:hypothetical protein
MKVGMCNMAPEPVSTAYFINPFHQSVSLYVYLPIGARQRLVLHVPTATNTRDNKKMCWTRRFLCGLCLIEGVCVSLCITLLLPDDDSVKISRDNEE